MFRKCIPLDWLPFVTALDLEAAQAHLQNGDFLCTGVFKKTDDFLSKENQLNMILLAGYITHTDTIQLHAHL